MWRFVDRQLVDCRLTVFILHIYCLIKVTRLQRYFPPALLQDKGAVLQRNPSPSPPPPAGQAVAVIESHTNRRIAFIDPEYSW